MKISNSHIASCLWALAFFSTSLGAAPTPAPPPGERALELELALAETPALYLVLHLAERRLEIKSRGVVLDRVALTDAALTLYSPLGSRGSLAAPVELPVVRRVIEPNPGTTRKVVTVKELAPYPQEDEEEETPEPAATHSPSKPSDPQPAASYRAALDGDWQLRIDPQATRPSFFLRLGRLVADAGRKALGKPAPETVILGLAMPADDARRLHHLLDLDMALLVR